jgi:uncharacterized repeat protein (TIGR01451 family)
VHDPLPTGLIVENIKAEPNTFACQVSENPVNVIDCTGELETSTSTGTNKEVKIDVTAFVTAADSTTFTNEACVNPNHTIVESEYNDNCSTVVTAANTPDLAISESAAISPISPGQNETYTIGVANTGSAPIPAKEVTVTDKLPAGLKFVQASGTNGFSCKTSGQEVTCTNEGGAFGEGGTSTIKVSAEVEKSAKGPLENPVSVAGPSAVKADDDDSASVSVNLNGTGIDLVAQSLKASPDPVNPGGVVTYTGVISNNGVQDSGEVEIEEVLPSTSEVTLESDVASNGFLCESKLVLGREIVTCKGDLKPGASTTVTTQVLDLASAPNTLKVTIEANPGRKVTESDYTNNKQETTTSIASSTCSNPPGCVDVFQSALVPSVTEVVKGEPLKYTYAVGNGGTAAAHELAIVLRIDKEQEGYTFESATATGQGFTCVHETNLNKELVVACNDPSCTWIVGSFTTPGDEKLSCGSGAHSDLPSKASVLVEVIGRAGSNFKKKINSEATFSQSKPDFSPSDDGPVFASTTVLEKAPAARGLAAVGVPAQIGVAGTVVHKKKATKACSVGNRKAHGKRHKKSKLKSCVSRHAHKRHKKRR